MYTHQGDKVVGLTVAYIGGGSRGWAWGFMRDIISDGQISGTVRLYDIDREAAERNQKIGTMLAAHPDAASKWAFEVSSSLQEGAHGRGFRRHQHSAGNVCAYARRCTPAGAGRRISVRG